MELTKEFLLSAGFDLKGVSHFVKCDISVTLFSWNYVVINIGGASGRYKKGYRLTSRDLEEFVADEKRATPNHPHTPNIRL